MSSQRIKSLLVAAFSLGTLFFTTPAFAQNNGENGQQPEAKKMDAGKLIVEHVMDAHEFHLLTIKDDENPKESKHISIPLPIIIYQKDKGFSVFMSSAFHHGEEAHDGYMLMTEEYMESHNLANVKDAKGQPAFDEGKIYAVDAAGVPDASVKLYDFSLTRNATQIFISLLLLIILLTGVAKKYRKGEGVKNAPKGWQNALEPVVTFIRDDVARPNLGKRTDTYLPLLLTIFFFILINNIFGLLPGSANVTGNIAFTLVLGVISFIVIMFSTNKHFWKHIFWPPVPHGVKPILIPVEILGIFTKPFALIVRLFANMIAGHIIITSFIVLIFIMAAMKAAIGWGSSPFFVALTVFIYLLEVLVAFIQAYIFANLTAVFIGQAFEGGHDHDEVHV